MHTMLCRQAILPLSLSKIFVALQNFWACHCATECRQGQPQERITKKENLGSNIRSLCVAIRRMLLCPKAQPRITGRVVICISWGPGRSPRCLSPHLTQLNIEGAKEVSQQHCRWFINAKTLHISVALTPLQSTLAEAALVLCLKLD